VVPVAQQTPKLIEAIAPLQFAIEDEDRSKWRIWILVALLALLIHGVLSLLDIDWHSNPPPMPVEINQVDPQKLAQIRKQWKQDILIDKDKSRPSDATKPKDARYFSDKNINVEKEQRARETNVLPKPGKPGPQAQAQNEPKPKTETQPRIKDIPDLSSLGVPLNLNQKPRPKPPEETAKNQGTNRTFAGDEGGDQAILDRDLPQGSENMLNAEESVYYSFYSRMYEAIAPIWQSRVREVTPSTRIIPGNYTTVVDVILDRDGNLIGVRQVTGSGVPVLDQAVETSWHKTGHFPNPPKDLLNAQGEIHTGWTFTVQLDQGSGLNYMPPERVY